MKNRIKDKIQIAETDERIKLTSVTNETNDFTYNLTIENCNRDDAGSYTAKLKNPLGEITTQTKLNVLYAPKFNKQLNDETNIKEKDTTKLTAEVVANPKPDIIWSKQMGETTEEITANDRFKIEAAQNNVSLTIKEPLLDDSATYMCTAKNKIGEAITKTKLNVSMIPKFTQTPDANKEVIVGEDVELKCVAKGFPLPLLQFINVEDKTLIESVENKNEIKTTNISDQEVEYILLIKSIDINSYNRFECKATNIAGEAKCTFNLNITSKPEFTKKPDEFLNLTQNSDLLVECAVLANPDAKLTWSKDGTKINPSKRILITEIKGEKGVKEKTYSMKILAAVKEDAGTYEIVATNKLGEAQCATTVVVEYPPIIVKDLKPKEKAVEGNSFEFECTIRGNPKPDITWYLGDKEIASQKPQTNTAEIKPVAEEAVNEESGPAPAPAPLPIEETSSANIATSIEDNVYKLNIKLISLESAGNYKAIAKNSIGQIQTVVCLLDVDTPPALKPSFEGVNPKEDSCDLYEDEKKTIVLEFSKTGKPEPSIEYYKDDVKYKATEKRIVLTKKENDVFSISFPDVKSDDTGVYKILAKNTAGEASYSINLKVKSPPKLVKVLKSKIESLENVKLELSCSTINGLYPVPEFKWFKNDELLEDNNQPIFTVLSDSSNSTLAIENVTLPMDKTKYKLVATNELGSCESETTLEVLCEPKFTKALDNSAAALNHSFEWDFEIDSNPEPKLKFIKNDKEIKFDNRIKFELISSETKNERNIHSYKLRIENSVADDSALYRIEASNKGGEAKSEAQLTVKGEPVFIRKPIDTSVPLNKPAKIECEVAGVPSPTVTWFINDEPLVFNDRVKIESKLNSLYWLSIKNAMKEDTAKYTVKLENEHGKAEESFNFSIQVPPLIVKALETPKTLTEGTSLSYECIITGNPIPTITWIRNKLPLTSEIESGEVKVDYIEKENMYNLIIDGCKVSDAGNYILKAKNALGEVSCTSQLTVQTKPTFVIPLNVSSSSAPTILSEYELKDSEGNNSQVIPKVSVNEKAQAKLECQVIGIPKPTIKWFNMNEELKNSDNYKLEAKQDNYGLVIKSFSVKEKGPYRVVAENPVDSSISQMYLDINTLPKFTKPLSNLEVILEDNLKIELECEYQSKPKGEVIWMFEKNDLKDGDRNGDFLIFDDAAGQDEFGNDNFNSKLKIQNVSLADTGTFKCKVKNCAGEMITACALTILKGPIITEQLPNVLDVNEKKEIKLSCQIADSIPKATVTWNKDDTPLAASKRIIISKPTVDKETGSSLYTLTIPEGLVTDSGVYKIVAENKVRAVDSVCNVNVLSGPRITKDLKPKLEVTKGETVKLEVTAVGKPNPDFKWYHFNEEINSEEEIVNVENVSSLNVTDNVYSLELFSINKNQEGKYTIKLSNSAGSVETSCTLTVNVPPTITKQLENTSVTEGSECTLVIIADGFPAPTIEWHKDNVKLKTDKRFVTKFEDNQYYFTITETKTVDQGEYKAILKNKCGQVEANPASLTITVGPRIVKVLKDIEIIEDNPLELTCEASGTPMPQATWFKGDQQLQNDDEKFKIESSNNVHTLKIDKSVAKVDAGLYRVEFKNEFGSSETKSNVTILIPPKYTVPLEDETIGILKNPYEFVVNILSKPPPKLKWMKDNKELLIKDRLKVEMNNVEANADDENLKEYKLVIDNVIPADAGVYKLEATNKCGSTTTQTNYVVKGAPIFERRPSDVVIFEKKPARIECELSGLPAPDVEWFKDGNLVENSDSIKIDIKNKYIHTLNIKSVKPENFGNYTIKAKNEMGEAECSIQLSVDIAPSIIVPLAEKISVKENNVAELRCKIDGSPKPTVVWSKRGVDLVESADIEITNVDNEYILKINAAKLTDSSAYNVVASNRVGKATSKTEVEVQTAPRFIRKIVDTQVIEKRLTKLEAEILAVPKPEIFWYKNGEQVAGPDDERIKSHDAKGGVYQLLVKNSCNDDTGTYVCKAVNECGEAQCSAQLVIEMAPQFLKKLEKLSAVEDCPAEWSFQLVGVPKPTIEFSKNNDAIDMVANADFYTIEEKEDYFYNLVFKNVRHKDIGNWTCLATNSAGQASCIARLETVPLTPPKFIKPLTDCRLPQDVDNDIEVIVSGIPFPQIEWFKDNVKIDFEQSASKYKADKDMVTGGLILKIINSQFEKDSGLYKARIFNPGGDCSSEGNILVKGSPPRFIEKPEKIYVLANKTASFCCIVAGDPAPVVTWSKGRNVAIPDSDAKMYYDKELDAHIMEIDDCKQKDAGTYQVTATNEFGTETAPVTLIITANEEEAIDYKSNLKMRAHNRRGSEDQGPDWGKLKKGGPREKDDEEEGEKIKLRHVEFEKKTVEEEPMQKPEQGERDPFVPREFDPRDLSLEQYVKEPKEDTDDVDGGKKTPVKKSALQTVQTPENMEFTKKLQDLTVYEHKLGVFECAVSDSEAQVTWYFNHQEVKGKRFQILSIGEFRRLAIRNCLIVESNTDVMCKWGELKTEAKLFVEDCPFIIKEGLKNQKIPKNTSAVLECKIINNLAPANVTLKWKKDGKPIDTDSTSAKYEFIIDGDSYALKIADFTSADVGNYEVYVVDPEDFDVSSSATIELAPSDDGEEIIEDLTLETEVIETEESLDNIEITKKPPKPQEPEPEPEPEVEPEKFIYKLIDVHVRKHETAIFELKVPTKTTRVKWFKDNEPIVPNEKYKIEQGKVNRLIITDAIPFDDEAKYVAKVEDEQVSALLTVEDFVEILKPLKDQSLFEKETLVLNVEVSDKNAPGTWYKDGVPLEISSNVTIESMNGKHQLTIDNCTLDHSGNYSFVIGDSKCAANVTINGKLFFFFFFFFVS
jgi:hemicentin